MLIPPSSDGDVRNALLQGFKGHCPACGVARLFGRFLKPVAACSACSQDWTHQRADDFPAYIVILLLGHLIVPLVIETNRLFALSVTVQMLLWPTLTAVLALALLQPRSEEHTSELQSLMRISYAVFC